jgi:hypothetical protein
MNNCRVWSSTNYTATHTLQPGPWALGFVYYIQRLSTNSVPVSALRLHACSWCFGCNGLARRAAHTSVAVLLTERRVSPSQVSAAPLRPAVGGLRRGSVEVESAKGACM